jgi:hypothetical protein
LVSGVSVITSVTMALKVLFNRNRPSCFYLGYTVPRHLGATGCIGAIVPAPVPFLAFDDAGRPELFKIHSVR